LKLRQATAQAGTRNQNDQAITAFSKIISALQIGINQHDYSVLVIETKTDYEAARNTISEPVQEHLDSAIEHLILANKIWKHPVVKDSYRSMGTIELRDALDEHWTAAQKEVEAGRQLATLRSIERTPKEIPGH
jgi:hypothetical protein